MIFDERTMMKLKKIFLKIIIVSALLISYAYASEPPETWYFYKVSKSTVYGETDETRDKLLQKREDIIEQFADTIIELTDSHLKINNQCLSEYSIHSTSSENYWGSSQNKNLYKNLFIKESIPLKEKIDVINFSESNKSCSGILNKLIKIDDYLVSITNEGYLIFFSKQADKKQLSSEYKGRHRPFSLFGHPMIKDKSIINQINKNCNFFADEDKSLKYGECAFDELYVYYPYIFPKVKTSLYKSSLNKVNDYEYYLLSKFPTDSNNLDHLEITLNIEKKGEVIDSIMIYKESGSTLIPKFQYYYIDNQLQNLWLLQIVMYENSSLTNEISFYEVKQIDYWKHYQIDENKHFKLIESVECNYKYDSPSSDSPTSWECK